MQVILLTDEYDAPLARAQSEGHRANRKAVCRIMR